MKSMFKRSAWECIDPIESEVPRKRPTFLSLGKYIPQDAGLPSISTSPEIISFDDLDKNSWPVYPISPAIDPLETLLVPTDSEDKKSTDASGYDFIDYYELANNVPMPLEEVSLLRHAMQSIDYVTSPSCINFLNDPVLGSPDAENNKDKALSGFSPKSKNDFLLQNEFQFEEPSPSPTHTASPKKPAEASLLQSECLVSNTHLNPDDLNSKCAQAPASQKCSVNRIASTKATSEQNSKSMISSTTSESPVKKRKNVRKSHWQTDEKKATLLRAAVWEIRFLKKFDPSTGGANITETSNRYGIPIRTLRRYRDISSGKDAADEGDICHKGVMFEGSLPPPPITVSKRRNGFTAPKYEEDIPRLNVQRTKKKIKSKTKKTSKPKKLNVINRMLSKESSKLFSSGV